MDTVYAVSWSDSIIFIAQFARRIFLLIFCSQFLPSVSLAWRGVASRGLASKYSREELFEILV